MSSVRLNLYMYRSLRFVARQASCQIVVDDTRFHFFSLSLYLFFILFQYSHIFASTFTSGLVTDKLVKPRSKNDLFITYFVRVLGDKNSNAVFCNLILSFCVISFVNVIVICFLITYAHMCACVRVHGCVHR